MKTILAILSLLSTAASVPNVLPAHIASVLPPGYEIIAHAHLMAGHPIRRFEIVALARDDEAGRNRDRPAPARPLLVFEQAGNKFLPAGRNDYVILKADEGGQCDPFLDNDPKIAIKGRFFTIHNGVACGQHWTDFITFRLDDHTGAFVFDSERREAWELNSSNDPDAEALVRAGVPRVMRDPPGRTTLLTAWRPQH